MTGDDLKNELISAIMELTHVERIQLWEMMKADGLIEEVTEHG